MCLDKQQTLKSDSITYPIHKSNIGKLLLWANNCNWKHQRNRFSKFIWIKRAICIEFFRQIFDKLLHLLSINQRLTFELSIYIIVDSKKIYVENLNIGAEVRESKNQKTFFRVPLISSTRRFLWNRFFANGGQEVTFRRRNQLKIEIRPYLNWRGLTGNIIAEGQIKLLFQ
jgi:hypothetical protein